MENQSIFPNGTQLQSKDLLITAHTKIIVLCVILLWSLVGNVLVILVIFSSDNLKTNFNYLIVNMAISDLVIPLLAIPLKITEEASGIQRRWLIGGPLGNVLCKLCYFLTDISPAVSVFSLVVIAANRLFAIVFPVQAQMFSKRKGWILICSTWIISIATFSPNLYSFRLVTYNNLALCITMWPSPKYKIIYFSAVIVVAFIIPFSAITVLYSIMMYKVHLGSKRVNNMLNNEQVRSRHRRNRQIFYISVAIVVSFLIFWGPLFTFIFVTNFIWQWQIPLDLRTADATVFVVVTLGYLNPCVNPCIYFAFLKNYRQGLKRIFTKRRHRTNSDSQTFYIRTMRSNEPPTTSAVDESCKLKDMKSTQL